MKLSHVAIWGLLALAPLRADVVLYDNGPYNGDFNAVAICCGQDIENSFTLASDATVTGFTFVDWNRVADPISSIDWIISSDAAGTGVFGSANGAAVSSSLLCSGSVTPTVCGAGIYDINQNTLSGLDILLTAGTYYLTLENAANNEGAFWDINNGPSTAYGYSGSVSLQNLYEAGTNSETFQIIGSSTPEPGTVALLAGGLLAAGVLRRRKATS